MLVWHGRRVTSVFAVFDVALGCLDLLLELVHLLGVILCFDCRLLLERRILHHLAEVGHPAFLDDSRRAMQVDSRGRHIAGNFAIADVLLKKLLWASCAS